MTELKGLEPSFNLVLSFLDFFNDFSKVLIEQHLLKLKYHNIIRNMVACM